MQCAPGGIWRYAGRRARRGCLRTHWRGEIPALRPHIHGTVFMRVIWGKCSIVLGYDVRDYGGVHNDWIRGFVPVLREFGLAYPATRPGWA